MVPVGQTFTQGTVRMASLCFTVPVAQLKDSKVMARVT